MFGIFASVASAFVSAVSSVCSAIAGVGSAIGASLSAGLSFVLSKGPEVLSAVANIVTSVMQALGLFSAQENPEDMGERILQASAAGIQPSKYDSFDEYMEKIRAFEINPDKQHSKQEQQLATLGVSALGISETKNLPIQSVAQLIALSAVNPSYFNAERYLQLIDIGAPLLNKVLGYFHEQLDSGGIEKVEKELVSLEKNLDSTRQDEQIYAELDAIIAAVRKDADTGNHA